jgi:two-component system response regulator PrrA
MTIPPLEATILVVDDDEAVTKTFDRVLSHHGYRVLTALNAEDALRVVDQNRPDALIVDLRMPVVDGLGLLYRVRSREAQQYIPAVVITGDTALSGDVLHELANLGAKVLYKPIEATVLLAEMLTLLGGSPC